MKSQPEKIPPSGDKQKECIKCKIIKSWVTDGHTVVCMADVEILLLQSLEQTKKEERKFVGKNKREWYQRGFREGQKNKEEELLTNALNKHTPNYLSSNLMKKASQLEKEDK